MKKKVLGVFLPLVFVLFGLYGQDGRKIIIPEDYSLSIESPRKFHVNDTLIIRCDTVFIINKDRYLFYKDLHYSVTNKKSDSLLNKIVLIYENRLKENEDAFVKLLNNSKKADTLTLDLIDYSQKRLGNIEKSLSYTQNTLNSSIRSLELANDYINKQQWNSIGQKVLIGIGGVGLGIIIGVLVNK
jgi:ElaB/YqjD/DUF883 family membrane-anchored ribosome-binding protein